MQGGDKKKKRDNIRIYKRDKINHRSQRRLAPLLLTECSGRCGKLAEATGFISLSGTSVKPSIFSLEVPSRNNRGFHMFPRLSRLCQGSLSVFISTQLEHSCRCSARPRRRAGGEGRKVKRIISKKVKRGAIICFAHPRTCARTHSRAVPGGRFVCCRRTLETHLRKKKKNKKSHLAAGGRSQHSYLMMVNIFTPQGLGGSRCSTLISCNPTLLKLNV